MKTVLKPLICFATIGLGACTTLPPNGPSVMALPGSTATFDQFRHDHALCGQYALDSIGGTTPSQAATDSAVNSAAVGTVVGAAAGAVIGAASHDPAAAAAAGAGTGLVLGSAAGIGAYQATAAEWQDRYDMAYVQCMYAKGHQLPLPASYSSVPASRSTALPPPPAAPRPPPPPNYPPPPGPPTHF